MTTKDPIINFFDIVMSTTEPGLGRVEPVSTFADDGEKLAMRTAVEYGKGWPDYFIQVRAWRSDGEFSTRLMVYPFRWPKVVEIAA